MVASLLYYRKFTNSLKSKGFIMNPYDPCVWNKTVEGKVLTICFHVDDCKISHASSDVLEEMISWLRQEYESIFEDGTGQMKVHRGKIHKFLGMSLDFSDKSHVKISMFDYVKDIVTSWDKAAPGVDSDGFKLVGITNRKGKITPAADDLFKVNEDAQKLPQSSCRANCSMMGTTRSSSSAVDTATAPGRVDSPPTSMTLAPCCTIKAAWRKASSDFSQRPPSENESGVRLRMPITAGRLRSS